jgi:hypothetical protein
MMPERLRHIPTRELREGVVIPARALTEGEMRMIGIDPEGVDVPLRLDAVDAFGLMLITDTETVYDAVFACLTFAGHTMPVGWRHKLPGASETHVNDEVTDVRGDRNGVTVNPRTAQKWATVARVANHFASHPGQDIATAAAELSLSQRHVYRIVTDILRGGTKS